MDDQTAQTTSTQTPGKRPLICRPAFVVFFIAWVAVFAFAYFAMHAGTLLKSAGVEVPVLIQIQGKLLSLFSEAPPNSGGTDQSEPRK